MYCPQCGSTNDENAAFCAACGTDLRKYRDGWSEQPAADAVDAATGPDDPAADAGSAPTGGPASGQPAAGGPSATPPPYQPQYQPQPQPGSQTPPAYQQAPPYPHQGYYPPPGYQQPGYPAGPQHPGYSPGVVPNIPSYLGWAITTLILCFWPTGIVAVVFATKVGNMLSTGNVWEAQEASRKAKMWCWITFGIGVAIWVFVIVMIVLAIAVWSETYIQDGTF